MENHHKQKTGHPSNDVVEATTNSFMFVENYTSITEYIALFMTKHAQYKSEDILVRR
jgi:hypothetical protein